MFLLQIRVESQLRCYNVISSVWEEVKNQPPPIILLNYPFHMCKHIFCWILTKLELFPIMETLNYLGSKVKQQHQKLWMIIRYQLK